MEEKTETKREPAKYKQQVVEKLTKLTNEYPIIGVVDMENMPAPQLQIMRGQLRETVTILMSKKRLMKKALEKSDKKEIQKLETYMKGMPALLFTKDNPFKLYKIIDKKKSPAPAKEGQIAPKDITIPAGPTNFAPGPIIGELGMFGIKTSVVDGKINVNEDKIVVKEGEEINGKIAGLLTRFGIQPMELGLDLVAVYEKGVIYDKKILAIDERQFMKNLENAAAWATNLAVEIGHYTKETIIILIPKAYKQAKAVALEGNIMCDLLAKELLEKAERQMLSLKTTANITDAPTKTEEKPEEPKKEEEKPEEPKVEEATPEPVKEETQDPKIEEVKEVPKVEEEAPKPVIDAEKSQGMQRSEASSTTNVVSGTLKEGETKEIPTPETNKAEQTIKQIEGAEQALKEIEENIKEEIKTVKEEIKKQTPNIPLIKEEIKTIKKETERIITEEKKQEVKTGEQLFKELKKEGTLRNIETKNKEEEQKPKEKLSPEEIIKNAHSQ